MDIEAKNGTEAVAVQRRRKYSSTTIELLLGKHVPEATVTYATGKTRCCLRGTRRGIIENRTGATSSVELCKGG
jgi:hypothetical protein